MPINLLAGIKSTDSQQQPINLLPNFRQSGQQSPQIDPVAQDQGYRRDIGEARGRIFSSLLGAGYEGARLPVGALNAMGMHVENPLQEEADQDHSMAFGLGRLGGGLVGGGTALGGIKAAASYAPPAYKLLSAAMKAKGIIPSALRGGIGGAAYEGTADYEDRLGGMMEGGMYGTGGGALAGLLASAGRALPLLGNGAKKQVGNILGDISGAGKINPKELEIIHTNAGKDLAGRIKTTGETHYKIASEKLKPILETVGNNKIKYPNYYDIMSKEMKRNLGEEARDLHNKFVDNTTFKNAVEQTSQIGTRIRGLLESPVQDRSTLNEIYSLKKAKKALLEDMEKHVGENAPELSGKYKEYAKYYAENYAPYKEHPTLERIVKGKQTHLGGNEVNSLFKIGSSAMKEQEKDMFKIANELGEQGKNRITFLGSLGSELEKATPESLRSNYYKLGKAGLEPYITPSLKKQIGMLGDTLEKTGLLKSNLKKAAGLGSLLIGGKMVKNYLPDIWG